MLKLKMTKMLLLIIAMFIMLPQISYAGWHEDPPIYETENIDNMWWLSSSKKEKLKKEQDEEIKKKKIENDSKKFKDKKIKWLYDDNDITKFPKNKWEIIDEDNDGIAYNYYFDNDGFLLIDTLTNDYKIVDKNGREVDYDFRPIIYMSNDKIKADVGIITEENDIYSVPTRESAKVIISKGVILKGKEKIFDNSINKSVVDYVNLSDRFIKETKGTIFNEIRWKKCSSLKGNGGFVIFNNPKNNFNKISGYISTEYFTDIDNNADCILKVYDADEYDKFEEMHHLYDIEEIYQNNNFCNVDPQRFTFTFDRSIKRLRFEIETSSKNKSLTCYFKDLKYGFNKTAFYEELIRKKDNEEEIEELNKLGIFVDDMWSFEAIDENGEIIEEEETEHENENNDDYIGGKSYVSEEETKSYDDVVRDRNTGPAFDEALQNIKEIGPGLVNVK